MSKVIAFIMPSTDGSRWCYLMENERLVLLLTGAYSAPYECPSDTPQGSSAESPLMVKINGCKLSHGAISCSFLFLLSLRRAEPSND